MEELNLDATQLHKKDLAGIGARHLMNRWGDAFDLYRKEVDQVWVTFGNWHNPGEKRSIKSNILNCLESGVVIPVINEADVISDREIKLMERGFSENDKLARMIAFLVEADAILFLTDKGGIYTKDPRKSHKAKLYKEISAWADPKVIGISNGSSENGTGGMIAKWKEASRCAKKGMLVAIAGNEKDALTRFVKGESVGTKVGIITRLK
jgi:glutamate 5-kinase